MAYADKVLKVGVMGPMTGPAAKVGEEFRNSTEMAFDKIGYKIGDYKIEIVWIDSQSDPAKATNAYSEAVERGGIQAGIMNWHSSVAVAVMEVTAQYKIPHFGGMGAASTVNEKWVQDPQKYNYWAGKGWPFPAKLIVGYIDVLEDAIDRGAWKPERRLVAVAAEETDWGRDIGQGFVEQFKAKGWVVVSEDYYPIGQTDFYPLMSKFKDAGVTAIGTSSAAAPVSSAFIKQASEVGVSKQAMIVSDGLGWVGEWYKLTGRASDGVIDMIPQLATPAAKAWAEAFEKKSGFKPSPSSGGLTYDLVNVWIKTAQRAFEKHGKLDSESIHEVQVSELQTGKLTYTDDEGAIIMTRYRYLPETNPDPVVGRDDFYFPVIQYKGGKGLIVYPSDWKEADLMVPK
jgi:branched-chain amino acid transport system substrate-binding protein